MANEVTASITEEDTFSDPLSVRGLFDFSLSGTWTATVTLQRSFDDGTTWLDVAEYTSNVEEYGTQATGAVKYRFGVKTGDFGSGTVVGRLRGP